MKNPNGYGSIHKLSGKRRKPYMVSKTTGWQTDPTTGKAKQIRETIGYYETRALAMQALANYNENPYDLDTNKITFAEIFSKLCSEKFDSISQSNINGYNAAFAVCKPIYDMRFLEIKKIHMQNIVDNCGKNYPTLRKIKVMFRQMYKYAIENDICDKDYSEFVDIIKHKEKGKEKKHKKFSANEIHLLWNSVNRNEYIQIILMLIYSGVRISELLDLKKDSVHLKDNYFDVIESKTDAGIRKVPIANKTKCFFEYWFCKNDCHYLLSTTNGEPLSYSNYRDVYWDPLVLELGIEHLPHDTRHTTISLLAAAEVNQTIIKRIVGHSGAMSLTEKVYTHFEIQQLIDAINKI